MQFTDRQQIDSLFSVCTDRTDRQIVSPLTKFNEMQFTDCQQTDSLFYNQYRLYRSSNRFTPWSTNRCIQLSDRQRIDFYFFSLTDRTDRMIDLTDCISASLLDMSVYESSCLVIDWPIFKPQPLLVSYRQFLHSNLCKYLNDKNWDTKKLPGIFYVFRWSFLIWSAWYIKKEDKILKRN